jgi:hypothetical protein
MTAAIVAAMAVGYATDPGMRNESWSNQPDGYQTTLSWVAYHIAYLTFWLGAGTLIFTPSDSKFWDG